MAHGDKAKARRGVGPQSDDRRDVKAAGAEQSAKTAKKTASGSATRKSGKVKSFDEQTIQARAYLMWIEEGRPDGRDVEHWLRACEELEREAA